MQVVFHVGAHCTDEDRLLKSLLKNRGTLKDHGVIVPGPGRYRKLIHQTIKSLDGAPATLSEQEELLGKIADDDNIKRMILSAEDFLSLAPWIFANKTLYGNAQTRAPALSNLFPHAKIEFHIGLRNPATFIPAAFARTKDLKFADFLRGISPYEIRWSDLIHTIRATNPKADITVWCNEDTPLIWSQLMHHMAGIDPSVPLDGEVDLLAEIMSEEGLKRFHTYLETHPPKSQLQLQRVVSVFLDKFAIVDMVNEELDAPGWTQDLVDTLTNNYEEDLEEIGRIPDVTFITP